MDIVTYNIRWYFNDESVALYLYEEDDEYPLNVTLSTPIPGVMIQIVQASLDATSFSYNSTMTANLSALIQEGVSNISCGSRTSRSKTIDIQGMHRILIILLPPPRNSIILYGTSSSTYIVRHHLHEITSTSLYYKTINYTVPSFMLWCLYTTSYQS